MRWRKERGGGEGKGRGGRKGRGRRERERKREEGKEELKGGGREKGGGKEDLIDRAQMIACAWAQPEALVSGPRAICRHRSLGGAQHPSRVETLRAAPQPPGPRASLCPQLSGAQLA